VVLRRAIDSLVVPVIGPAACVIPEELQAYSDSDQARCQDTRSVTDFVYSLLLMLLFIANSPPLGFRLCRQNIWLRAQLSGAI